MDSLIIKQENTGDEELDIEDVMEQDFAGLSELESIPSDLDKARSAEQVFRVSETNTGARQSLTLTSVSTASSVPTSQLRMVSLTNNSQAAGVQPTQNSQILVGSSGQTPLVQTTSKKLTSDGQQKVVTKFIIAPKGASGQQQVLSVGPHGLQPAFSTSGSGLIGQPGVASSIQIPKSPTKTFTLSQSGVLSPKEKILTSAASFSGAKLQLSPAKTPPKQTMIAFAKSPTGGKQQQFVMLKAGGVGSIPTTRAPSINMSPSKILIRGQTPVTLSNSGESNQPYIVSQTASTSRTNVTQAVSVPSNVQPLSVSGSKFQYVRLVTTPSSQAQTGTTARPTSIAPAPQRALVPATNTTSMKLAMPVNTNQNVQLIQQKQTSNQTQQRLILPATSQVLQAGSLGGGVRSVGGSSGSGTMIPSSGPVGPTINLPGLQGFALIPAQYIAQPTAQSQQSQHSAPVVKQEAFQAAQSNKQSNNNVNGRNSAPTDAQGQRPRKPCNCTKSQCLKLYCDCFANGEFCSNCNCNNCFNNLDHEEERQRAIKTCLERNPHAFHPKIGKGRGGTSDRRHNKGCNCKRSGCLKNYCECYEAKIMCSNLCKCVGCKNFEESPDRKTLMHLADAAEVRHQQQTAAKTKLSSQIQDVPARPQPPSTGQRLPYTFVTPEVAEATCACLVAQAEEAERTRQQEMMEECMILQEFGRCLMQVIQSATKTKAPSPVP